MKRRDFLRVATGSALASAAGLDVAAQPVAAGKALDLINHVVVLMLENRSFDNLLGKLYPRSDKFDGLAGTETNPDMTGAPIPVNNLPGHGHDILTTPNPNPGELWADVNEQLFGARDAPPPGAVPAMNGFVRNYLAQTSKPASRYDARRIMHYFTPEQTPVLSTLATEFAVCDRWFASSPTQTWPNRFFLHCGTAGGYENNLPVHFPYRMPTIFERLQAMDPINGWHVYYHDIPQSLTLANLWKHRSNFSRFDHFIDDAADGALPAYAFIEPDYFPFLGGQSDEHPPSSIATGEALIAKVYNALRQGPAWTKTLLIVIFDEHGGCYDHVPPPAAVPPHASASAPFNFDRFGVRVPAVLVSPYISKGQVLRPPGATPFDHTSVIATLRKRFGLGGPLTDRDAAAPSVDGVLNLPEPTNNGPERIELPASTAARAAATSVATQEPGLTDLQRALFSLSGALPAPGAEEARIRGLSSPVEATARSAASTEAAALTPTLAGRTVEEHMRRFRGEP